MPPEYFYRYSYLSNKGRSVLHPLNVSVRIVIVFGKIIDQKIINAKVDKRPIESFQAESKLT